MICRLLQLGSQLWKRWDYGNQFVHLHVYMMRGWGCWYSFLLLSLHGFRLYQHSKPASCLTRLSAGGWKSLLSLLETTQTPSYDDHLWSCTYIIVVKGGEFCLKVPCQFFFDVANPNLHVFGIACVEAFE